MIAAACESFEPQTWLLIFNHEASTWWRSFLAFGRFKHVWACAYVPGYSAWLIYDVHLAGTTIGLVPAGERFNDFLGRRTAGMTKATVISMPRALSRIVANPLILLRRPGFWCVPAIAHLIGLRAATLRPDALYRHCLSNGATLFEPPDGSPSIQAIPNGPGLRATDAAEPATGRDGDPIQVAG